MTVVEETRVSLSGHSQVVMYFEVVLYEPSPLLAACVCASCVGSATVHVICRKAVPWVPRWPFVVRACALHHLRGTCAVLRGTINIAACCFATRLPENPALW